MKYAMTIKISEWLIPGSVPYGQSGEMLDAESNRRCCLQHYVEQVCGVPVTVTNLAKQLGDETGFGSICYPHSILNLVRVPSAVGYSGKLMPEWAEVAKESTFTDGAEYAATSLANKAALINDQGTYEGRLLSIEERKARLIALFAEHDIELTFIDDQSELPYEGELKEIYL